jgi:malic enzyme
MQMGAVPAALASGEEGKIVGLLLAALALATFVRPAAVAGGNSTYRPVQISGAGSAAGGISNLASAGSMIGLPGLGEFRTIEAFGRVSVHDRIGEIHDMIDRMNGQPGAVSICISRFKDYAQEPTPQA